MILEVGGNRTYDLLIAGQLLYRRAVLSLLIFLMV